MPWIKPKYSVSLEVMRQLDAEYQRLVTRSNNNAPRGGVPVGGGEWMDSFFRSEAIRGMLGAFRLGKSVEEALADGKAVGEISIQIWNKKREWQVHRWAGFLEDYLQRELDFARQRAKAVVS